MRKKTKLVYGIGINDADYSVQKFKNKKLTWLCPFYSCWRDMLKRCYSKKYQLGKQSYVGCQVCQEWLTFSNFKLWMESQDWKGKHLDKDIIALNSKTYSPSNCAFVSPQLNTFLAISKSGRGSWPIGVSWNKKDKKFRASGKNPFTGKPEYMGSFDCPIAAHEAWRKRKHEFACIYADMQEDSRVAESLRQRFA